MNEIDMRTFAANVGSNMRFPAGSVLFSQGHEGDCAFIVQSGSVEMMVGDRKVDECGENDVLGYMSLIDGSNRSSTARAVEDTQVSVIDAKQFRFMVDEIPNFASYVMGAMAQRIRGMAASY